MKRALLYDHGLSPFVATKVAEGFDETGYYTPYQADAFPCSRKRLWGTGLPNVQRVVDFFDAVDEADTIVFPDHSEGDLQDYLKRQGKNVWGSGLAEALELDRIRFRELQRTLGMPVRPYKVVKGMEALRRILENPKNENTYVKLSEWRGDLETFHHENWFLSETWHRELAHRLGPMGEELDFLIETAIDDAVEVGFDGVFVANGFCNPTVYGYEVKDTAYIGRVCDYDELPGFMLEGNALLAPVLTQMDCRSFVSLEYRVTEDGTAYLTDPCLRLPSPPGGALMEVFGNWPEVIAAGARGRRVAPEPRARFCAELVLRSDFATEDFLAIEIPEKYRHLVKLHGHAIMDGVDYVVAIDMDIIGGAVGLGDTVDEACDQAMEVAESLKAYQLDWSDSAFDTAKERIKQGADECGIPWED